MREHTDFSSISKLILANRKLISFSHEKYYQTLFEYAFDLPEKDNVDITENSNANKIIKGSRGVPKAIIAVYCRPEGKTELQNSLKKLMNDIIDPYALVAQVKFLVNQDNSISPIKKAELCNHDASPEAFLASCLMFALTREFIPTKTKISQAEAANTVLVSDFIRDCHLPRPSTAFLGREKELATVSDKLSAEPILFLSGIGGIGKSELVKKYAKLHQKDYINVIYLRYHDSLHRTIADIDTPNMTEEQRFQDHMYFFKLLHADSLVILDNFDSVPEEDPLFHDFINLAFTLLVTTRSRIEDVPCYPIEEIDSIDTLAELFCHHAPSIQDKKLIIHAIIEEVYRHTLTVEMAAKTIKASGITPEALPLTLQSEGLALSNLDKIKVTKDARTKTQRLYQHIETLFRLQHLSETQEYYLRHMLLMPQQGIPKQLFRQWMQIDNLNHVNDLIDYGWIQEDTETALISMHPFVHEVIMTVSVPTFENCPRLMQSVFLECFAYGRDISYYSFVIQTIESISKNIRFTDETSSVYFIESAINFLDKYAEREKIDALLDIMNRKILSPHSSKRDRALYLLYQGGQHYAIRNYPGAETSFKNALDILKPIRPNTAELACNLYHNLGQVTLALYGRTAFIKNVQKMMEIRTKFFIPFNHNAVPQITSYAMMLFMKNQTTKARNVLHQFLQNTSTIPNFETSRADIYSALGLLYNNNPEKSRACSQRAYYLAASHYPPNHPRVRELEQILRQKCLPYKPPSLK